MAQGTRHVVMAQAQPPNHGKRRQIAVERRSQPEGPERQQDSLLLLDDAVIRDFQDVGDVGHMQVILGPLGHFHPGQFGEP
jgi:hypothetical protein